MPVDYQCSDKGVAFAPASSSHPSELASNSTPPLSTIAIAPKAGDHSVAGAKALGSAAPKPIPLMKRRTASCETSAEVAPAKVNSPKNATLTSSVFRLPNLSHTSRPVRIQWPCLPKPQQVPTRMLRAKHFIQR